MYPNPTNEHATLEFENNNTRYIQITDVLGNIVRSFSNYSERILQIEKSNLSNGVYFISVIESKNKISNTKLIIQ
ncbi:MAG: T9SS type A sorting domain-containing protein [Bacteroidetes bacterium]|nr:T9SS type A sorting domain-containing protein [Bacteroidota bacterium]